MSLQIMCVGDIYIPDSHVPLLSQAVWPGWDLLCADVDFLFGNLESPATAHPPDVLDRRKCRIASSPEALQLLKQHGFGALCLANNHVMDAGAEGLDETIRSMKEVGLQWFGAGSDLNAAKAGLVVEIEGTLVGFLGYAWPFVQADPAGPNRHGVAPLRRPNMLSDVRSLRQKTDLVVVSLHWGYEGECYPLPCHRALAQSLIDTGARLVVGHHPHVVQGIEHYGNGIIAYSLGNFVFPDIEAGCWCIHQSDNSRTGIAIKLSFTNESSPPDLAVIPIHQAAHSLVPTVLRAAPRAAVLRDVGELSSHWGSSYCQEYRLLRTRQDLPVLSNSPIRDTFLLTAWHTRRLLRSSRVISRLWRTVVGARRLLRRRV